VRQIPGSQRDRGASFWVAAKARPTVSQGKRAEAANLNPLTPRQRISDLAQHVSGRHVHIRRQQMLMELRKHLDQF
jgi:hypothetical protein